VATEPRIKLMLDSGAYSAWRQNKTISLPDYIAFVKEVKDYVATYVNLDVIPGSKDRMRTWQDAETAANRSDRNLQAMKDQGLRPLAVFHQGELVEWLQRMLMDGTDYIAISTNKNQPDNIQRQFLDLVFSVLTDEAGAPLVKVHGLGVAHVDLLKRFPFASVDANSWQTPARYGKIYIPPYVDGRPDYLNRPEMVTVSGNFQHSRYSQRRQLSNGAYFGPGFLPAFQHFIEEEVGLNVALVRRCPVARSRVGAVYYSRVVDALPEDIRFRHRQPLPPDERRVWESLMSSRQPLKLPPLQFYFVTNYDRIFCDLLLKANATRHLLSYWQLKNRPDALAAYAMEGKVG
jgi:hypothetical protein